MTQSILGIAGIVGAITAVLTFVIKTYGFVKRIDTKFSKIDDIETNVKALDSKLENSISHINERSQLQDEALRAMLRNNITSMYYKHVDIKTLREYEFEEMIQEAEVYFKLGGNSYVRELYEKMCEWDVIG